MYTNGFTKQKFLSVVGFKDAAGRTHAFLESEFAEQCDIVFMTGAKFQITKPDGTVGVGSFEVPS